MKIFQLLLLGSKRNIIKTVESMDLNLLPQMGTTWNLEFQIGNGKLIERPGISLRMFNQSVCMANKMREEYKELGLLHSIRNALGSLKGFQRILDMKIMKKKLK